MVCLVFEGLNYKMGKTVSLTKIQRKRTVKKPTNLHFQNISDKIRANVVQKSLQIDKHWIDANCGINIQFYYLFIQFWWHPRVWASHDLISSHLFYIMKLSSKMEKDFYCCLRKQTHVSIMAGSYKVRLSFATFLLLQIASLLEK